MNRKHLWNASKVYAPDFPRQCSDDATFQKRRDTRADFVAALESASSGDMPGYYSVYSFPRGHTRDNNIPKVDCIFIDLDVVGENYRPNDGETSFHDWKRDMSALLARARMIGDAILDAGEDHHFRVTLSGHKGLHLYLDFPPIDPANGTFGQFKNGLSKYGETVMEWLDELAGGINIEPWVDVDASDLGRLARHPNTRHHGAAYDDEDRWCVPITVEEMAEIDCEQYLEYTRQPRPIPEDGQRIPSESAGKKVAQYIREATENDVSRRAGSATTYDPARVKEYKEQSNDDITLDDVLFLTANKPCIRAFRERDDAYEYGQESRAMELSIMGRFIQMDVPIDVMHEFFEPIPGYDKEYTQQLVEDLIGRSYGEFNCDTIVGTATKAGDAERFCLGSDCGVYRRESELQKS